MDQVSIKFTNIFHSKTLQNLPKFGFLVREQTIWQPCAHIETGTATMYVHTYIQRQANNQGTPTSKTCTQQLFVISV
jgi:hypothetical protein